VLNGPVCLVGFRLGRWSADRRVVFLFEIKDGPTEKKKKQKVVRKLNFGRPAAIGTISCVRPGRFALVLPNFEQAARLLCPLRR
jgi:hypothetical protein